MEFINCNFCDSNVAEPLFSKKDKYGVQTEDFHIVRCRNCGLIYVNPRPTETEIVEFYPETYSWKETLTASSLFTRVVRKLEKIYRYHYLNYEVDKVLRYTKLRSGMVLDIGCGTGDRLKIFKEKGFETLGVEISSSAIYAKEALGLNVVHGNLHSAHYPDNYFDIVTMYNVLEHVHKPAEIVREVNRILKKGGFLVIEIPNTDSLQFKRYGKRWAAFDVPRDLYYFNPGLLSALLGKSGLKVLIVDHKSSFLHPPTIVISLFPDLDPCKSWLDEKGSKGTVLKRLKWVFWTLVLSTVAFSESLKKQASIITVFSERSV